MSKPTSGASDATDILGPVVPALDIAWGRDASVDPDGEWLSFVPTAPPLLNTLQTVDDRMGLWLFLQGEQQLAFEGDLPVSQEIGVWGSNRWNLVGYPSVAVRSIAEVLQGVQYQVVCAFDATDEEDPWQCYDPTVPEFLNDLQDFEAGRGYLVLAISDGSFIVSD